MNAMSRQLLALLLCLAAGCAGTAPPLPNAGAQESPAGQTVGATLMNTPWRILSLANEPVEAAPGKREPQLILKNEDGRDSWSATVGCNQMSGGVTVDGNRIAFKSGMSTLMACPPPLDVVEKQLGRSLLASTQWRIQGNRLELRDDAGVQTFLCEVAPPR
jgi:heat shock protein HslJ